MDTVTMGSPLSLAVVANYFMEYSNEEALSEAAYAFHCWFQYADIYNMATKAEKLTALLDYLKQQTQQHTVHHRH
jgi:hypothetical protein